MSEASELLTTEQVANLLNVTTTTVRNYRTAGLLEGRRVGHGRRQVYRYALTEVLAFANAHDIAIDAPGVQAPGEPKDDDV